MPNTGCARVRVRRPTALRIAYTCCASVHVRMFLLVASMVFVVKLVESLVIIVRLWLFLSNFVELSFRPVT